LWQLIKNYCQKSFNIELEMSIMHIGQFLINIFYHCKIEINWKKINVNLVFQGENFMTEDMILGIKVKTKIFQPVTNDFTFQLNDCLK
jgi:hypothetical protein